MHHIFFFYMAFIERFYSFFRHALEDSLERAFVPALAAVVSFIDVRQNLLLLTSNASLEPLWMLIFAHANKLGLTYDAEKSPSKGSRMVRFFTDYLLLLVVPCLLSILIVFSMLI